MTVANTVALDRTEPFAIGHRQALVAFSGLILAMLLAALDSTIVSTALPTIVGELGGLETSGLVERVTSPDGARWCLTPAGCDSLNRLIDARRAHLADLIAEWPIEQREGVAQHLRAIAEALVPTVPTPSPA